MSHTSELNGFKSPSKSTSGNLKANKEVIMRTWEARVRHEIEAASRQNRTALRDSLPKQIDKLVEELSGRKQVSDKKIEQSKTQLAEEHAEERSQMREYSLYQVIYEYQVFREVIFQILEEEIEQLSRNDREIILNSLQIAIRTAAEHYAEVEIGNRSISSQLPTENKFQDNALKELAATKIAETRSETEEILSAAIENIKDYAILTLDPNGKITSWNGGAVRLNGYTAEEALGMHFSKLYPSDSRSRHEPEEHLAIAKVKGRFRCEAMRLRKDHSFYLADALITPLYRETGTLFGFSKVVFDLTERNFLIEDRDRSRVDIENFKSERELRDRFVNTLSHDLRNPLTAARMNAQMINRLECTNSKHLELSKRITISLGRADNMLTDLLDVSQIKAGKSLPLELSEICLNELVEDLVNDLKAIHGSRFNLKVSACPKIRGDSSKIRRAVENLATNAIKYGSSSKPIIIELQHIKSGVRISVCNFGNPIQSADLNTLFDPFHRTESAKSSGKEGWGLGLTLVRGVAEAHGGRIKVQSGSNIGTTFTLEFPLSLTDG